MTDVKKIIGIFLILMLLSACSAGNSEKKEESSSALSSSTDSTASAISSTVDKEVHYRQELEKARNEQQEYINSLSENQRSGVQTVHSAILAKANELIQANANDQEMIHRLATELTEADNPVDTSETKAIDIADIMVNYAKEKSMTYNEATPATVRKYYDLSVPDEALSNAYLNKHQIAFKFYDLQLGNGEIYQLNASYVNETGTELILFTEKDGKRFIFQTTIEPKDGKILLEISQQQVLNQYLQ